MNKNSAYSWTKFLAMFCLCSLVSVSLAVAQEVTAGIQGTIKDSQGAVVNGATVEVTSPVLIGTKKSTTEAGYYRFANLPPGTYTITVTAANFATQRQENLKLETGVLPTINFTLKIGSTAETVEVSSQAPIVEVAQSKKQATATEEIIDALPKGRSFQSIIGFAPGAKNEPLQGGYQIDGASNAENSYLIEGQDTGSIRTGLSNANSPFEFVQEVQIKSSGFEAEYGGALGGVVNVVQKHGTNAWHGEVWTYYSGDAFNAAPAQVVRLVPSTSQTFTATTRSDRPFQVVTPIKDHFRQPEPGFAAGGPIIKDRIWGFASFAPQFFSLTRTIDSTFIATPGGAQTGPRAFTQTQDTYYSYARLDALATQRIRVFGSWQYAYSRINGNALPGADWVGDTMVNGVATGPVNSSASSNPNNFNNGIGQTQPNVLFGAGADITITPNLIATSRFGDFYQNFKDFGLPTGIRYTYRSSNYPYSTSVGVAAGATGLDNTVIPAAFVQPGGFANIGANTATLTDALTRTSYNQDLAWFKKGWGTHNFKFGYALNNLTSDVNNGYNTASYYVAYNTQYKPLPSNYANCIAIENQNFALYGKFGGSTTGGVPDGHQCQGDWGTVNIRELGTIGLASSKNHALYAQDAWNIGHGITLNVGIRADKESLPSFKAGLPGIDFGFGDKIAPRLGVAWDVLGNGKVKVYGSYGKFYDIMKYELPRGSFGGDYWHDCVYALDSPNPASVIPVRGADGHFCPATGGANGTVPARFIQNEDFRITSNSAGGCGIVDCIDPNLKPMSQHEYVVGADWAITPTIALETRFTAKRLDRTIEDTGIITPLGEQYFISNPGESNDTQPVAATDCTGCPNQPKATRRYNGLEFRLIKRASNKWFGQLSYTYSRETGNYNGLTNSDTSDGGSQGQRTSPNVSRAFDEPYMQYDSHGNLIDGPLATDRPNALKFNGYYRVKWLGMETLLGGTTVWESGTPLTTYLSEDQAPQDVEGRGNFALVSTDAAGNFVLNGVQAMRTPAFSQVDLNFVHEIHVSKTNENLKLAFEANILNVLNQRNILSYDTSLTDQAGDFISLPGAPATSLSGVNYKGLMTGYNYIQELNTEGMVLNSTYGQPNFFQTGRSLRFKVRFTF